MLENLIWDKYTDIYRRAWGLTRNDCGVLGVMGKRLFDAEYKALGEKAYSTSIIQPLRNTLYMKDCIGGRWALLKKFPLPEPILDYGCGVGFTLAWLSLQGYKDLHGYEVEGVQRNLHKEYGKELGFQSWGGPTGKFGTVLCFNVLEHHPEPLKLLEYLYTLSDNVVASIATDDDTDTHIAAHSEREDVIRLLNDRGDNLEEGPNA